MAIKRRRLHEFCCECGVAVNYGSGKWVNRIAECNPIRVRREMGRPYPMGDFICAECDDFCPVNG